MAMTKFWLAAVGVLVSTSVVHAADVEPVPTVYDWSGFYIGGNAGAAWSNSSVEGRGNSNDPIADAINDKIDSSDTAFTAGGEIGFNWQMDSVVIGLETDFNYLGFSESNDRTNNFGGQAFDTNLSFDTDWYGTFRGRLGFAFDNVLIYGTGGVAYGDAKVKGGVNVDGVEFWDGKASDTNWGWTLGGGAEFALNQNWILGAEYLYVDLGSNDFDFDRTAANNLNDKVDGHYDAAFSVVRATVKYKF